MNPRLMLRPGVEAKSATPALIGALKDRDRFVRLSALVELPEDEEPPVRASAATALGKMGSDAGAALPALNKLQNDQATVLRLAVAEAVSKIASHGMQAQ